MRFTDAPIRNDKDFMGALAKGLAVLELFNEGKSELTISEVAARTGLSAAAARRCLLTLMELGYLTANRKQFSVTAKVLNLSYTFLSSTKFWMVAQNALDSISDDLNLSCSAAVLEGEDIVFVVHAPVRSTGPVIVVTGTRQPAFATAMGRVLLAHLPDDQINAFLLARRFPKLNPNTKTDPDMLRAEILAVRKRGYALIDQEATLGTCAVAVPVVDRNGRLIAAINAAARTAALPAPQLKDKALDRLLELSHNLGAQVW